MNGKMVQFPANGRTCDGYLCLPSIVPAPGLIVLQEYWGLVAHIKDLTDRFAAAGFCSLAPDLYHGSAAGSPDEAEKLLMALNITQAAKDLRGAIDYLRKNPGAAGRKVGVIGFCMGGQLALFAAQEHGDVVDAVVDFYGIHPKVVIDPARVKAPVLGHFGRKDRGCPPESGFALRDAVNAVGGRMEVHEYDAGHAFFNDARPQRYDADAAALAWDRTLAFLTQHLT